MRGRLFAICGLFSLCVQAEGNGRFSTRGAFLELPFRLRVLIQDLPAEASTTLRFSGRGLSDETGTAIGAGLQEVTCRWERRFPALLSTGMGRPPMAWICRSGAYERPVDGFARFQASEGLLQINNKFYKGALDLFPQIGRLSLINELDLESYLAGLVNKEIRSDYPLEAVKAQVVAARSYALAVAADRRRQGSIFDLYNTQADQVYDGAHYEDERARQAVLATLGETLFHNKQVLKAYYHSSSGGHSEVPASAWIGREKDPDHNAFRAEPNPWDLNLNKWEIALSPYLGMKWSEVGRLFDVRVTKWSPGKRAQQVILEGQAGRKFMSGAQFRNALGTGWLKSLRFDVAKHGSGWKLMGQGWGHGVGMSQLGAKAMAQSGKDYKDILAFHYPFASIVTLSLNQTPGAVAVNPTAPAALAR